MPLPIGKRLVVRFTLIAILRESKHISLNCLYFRTTIRTLAIINNNLNLITVFPFEIDQKALNSSREWNTVTAWLREAFYLAQLLALSQGSDSPFQNSFNSAKF